MGSLVLKMEGSHEPRNADSLKMLEKGNRSSPRISGRSTALLTPGF